MLHPMFPPSAARVKPISYTTSMVWLTYAATRGAQTCVQHRESGGVMDYARGSGGVTRGARVGHAPRLMDVVRRKLRVKHYSLRTEQAYVAWIRRFILANGKRHPRELGGAEVERFLSELATVGGVAAGTQNQALSALLFLYRQVLGIELPWMGSVVRAKRPRRLPTAEQPGHPQSGVKLRKLPHPCLFVGSGVALQN